MSREGLRESHAIPHMDMTHPCDMTHMGLRESHAIPHMTIGLSDAGLSDAAAQIVGHHRDAYESCHMDESCPMMTSESI